MWCVTFFASESIGLAWPRFSVFGEFLSGFIDVHAPTDG